MYTCCLTISGLSTKPIECLAEVAWYYYVWVDYITQVCQYTICTHSPLTPVGYLTCLLFLQHTVCGVKCVDLVHVAVDTGIIKRRHQRMHPK